MSYPFRFYGHKPADWHEGANDGHILTLCFARVPTDAELEQLAAAFEFGLSTGTARPARAPWLWSDRFARFLVGERSSGYARTAHFLGPVTRFVRAAHGIVPLEEVAFHGVRELADDDRWTRWSLAQGDPTPGPDFNLASRYVIGVDGRLPPASPSDIFEAGREAGRKAMADDAMREIIAAEPEPGTVGVAPFAPTFEPPRTPWPEALRAQLDLPPEGSDYDAPGERMADWVDARPIGYVYNRYSTTELIWFDEDGQRQMATVPAFSVGSLDVHPDGDRVLVANSKLTGGAATCLDLSTGEHATWYVWSLAVERKGHEAVKTVAWVDGGTRFAVVLDSRMRIFEPAPEDSSRPTEVASRRVKADKIKTSRDGRLFVLSSYPPQKALTVLALNKKNKLKKLGSWKIEVGGVTELDDGRIVFRHGYRGSWYELTGIDDALEALDAPRKRTKTKA